MSNNMTSAEAQRIRTAAISYVKDAMTQLDKLEEQVVCDCDVNFGADLSMALEDYEAELETIDEFDDE